MKFKWFLIAFICLLSFTALAADPRVQKAEQWLNSLTTAQSRFVQTNPDGKRLTGTFYLKRPGRLRFEYDAPVKDFIVADGFFIYYYDGIQRQASNMPIGSTLADFILRKNIRLDKELKVVSVRQPDSLLLITLVQTADPNAGKLVLGLNPDTYALKKWQVYDPAGNITQIDLKGLESGIKIDPVKFTFKDPSGRTKLNN